MNCDKKEAEKREISHQMMKAVILAAHLLLTLVSGMALKLYDATPGQDEYQKAGFGAVLITECVMRSVRIGQYCREYNMFEREGHEVFEKRAEKRGGSRGKSESSRRRRHRNDT